MKKNKTCALKFMGLIKFHTPGRSLPLLKQCHFIHLKGVIQTHHREFGKSRNFITQRYSLIIFWCKNILDGVPWKQTQRKKSCMDVIGRVLSGDIPVRKWRLTLQRGKSDARCRCYWDSADYAGGAGAGRDFQKGSRWRQVGGLCIPASASHWPPGGG